MSVPETMTAIAIREPGGADALIAVSRRVPQPGPHEVLIRVHAAGVNRPDIAQRQGHYPPPPGVTDIPGLEIAGEVAACGQAVRRWSLGDKVTALVPGGGYAEYCAVHETNALPVPPGLSLNEAAAIPETYFTVWSNVFDRGRLKRGETLLIHGGASGIGTVAIQLGTAFGANVVVTASTDEKCAACLALGATRAINYKERNFIEAVRAFTGGAGADVILDMIGGEQIQKNYEAAAPDGRIVQIAFLGGTKAEVDFRILMTKRLTHTGSTLRARPVEFKAAIAQALEDKVWPLLAAGTVKPVIDSTFPLEEVADAHRRVESRSHVGKVVLTVG